MPNKLGLKTERQKCQTKEIEGHIFVQLAIANLRILSGNIAGMLMGLLPIVLNVEHLQFIGKR